MQYKLDEIFDIQIGKTPSRSNDKYWGGNNNWICIRDLNKLNDDKYIVSTKEKITDIAIHESGIKQVPPNTLLYSFKLSVGRVAITKNYIYTNEAIAAFIPKEEIEINIDYLFYLLKSKKVDNILHNAVMGKSLNKEKLKNITIELPNITIQNAVSTVLDTAYSLITKRKKMIQLLDEYSKSLFLEMFGDPVLNPQNWKLEKINNLVPEVKNAIKAGPFGSALKKEYYVSSGYKIYGQEQVINNDFKYGDYYIDSERFNKLKSCKIQAQDVLISLVGTLGKVAIVPDDYEQGIINPRLVKISFDKQVVNPLYFKYLFETEYIKAYLGNISKGGGVKSLNLTLIKQIEFPIPNIEIQNEFENNIRKISILNDSKKISICLLEELFQSLIHDSFGKKEHTKKDEIEIFMQDQLKIENLKMNFLIDNDKSLQQYEYEKDLLFKVLERTEQNNAMNTGYFKGLILKFEEDKIVIKTNNENKFDS